ncbi:phosphoribosylanthranilate isomerase [Acetobacteraceae bacterium ESL0709]|nr:phosphoribosylanthranilate isomerase [Acetobacteraceae bacterium ESL0697]MDF7678008.1 phosphoribosylanthranilate isomerase [Acetobacteraceae bacterium ESL0709]
MVKVKICGLKRAEEMQLCAALGVDWTGFIFYPPSPRYIPAKQALDLHHSTRTAAEGGPQRVGLFVNPTFDEIKAVLAVVPLDILQLYGPIEQAVAIRQRFDVPVWLAKGIKGPEDLPSDKNNLDGYIIESPADPNDNQPGGLGKSFDWSLTRNWPAPAPWILAGGLTPENVSSAIMASGTSAVDVSSGVEESRGVKSLKKIEKFVRNCR